MPYEHSVLTRTYFMCSAKSDTSSVSQPEAGEGAPVNTSSQPQSVQSAAESALMYVLSVHAANAETKSILIVFGLIELDRVAMNTTQW